MAERLAHTVYIAAPEDGVGAREVDVLEDALEPLGGAERLERVQSLLVHHEDLPRLDVAHDLGLHEIERARLGGEQPGVSELSEGERPEARRIAHADHA